MIKKLICRILIPVLLITLLPARAAFAETAAAGEAEALDYLAHELETSADHLMETGEDVDDIYSELNWTSVADTFPEKFDLRERGTVTPVRSQSPWGTCWSFATIAASETSILNSLGMTADSYREQFGEDMDLSEKHLAWFTTQALPALDAYPEGEYPYEASQAGEGLYILEGTDIGPLNTGGNYFLSSASLASGIGILKEKYAPYVNSEGNAEKSGDWSLPEEDRFAVSFELKDANMLPSPSSFDADGKPPRPSKQSCWPVAWSASASRRTSPCPKCRLRRCGNVWNMIWRMSPWPRTKKRPGISTCAPVLSIRRTFPQTS